MEAGSVSDCPVDLVSPSGIAPRIEVDLEGLKKRFWSMKMACQNGLASDHDEVVADDVSGCSKDMLELRALQASARSSTARSSRRRSCSVRTPANGELCRSSRALPVSAPIALAILGKGRARIRSHSSAQRG
ncbi:MAG: hypothetical protein ABR521_02845 [Gaiellaceae bacterium]